MAVLPAILMMASTAATVAGTVTSAIGAQKEGEATKAAYDANAKLMELQGKGIEQAGAYEEAKIAREKRLMLGRQRAAYAKSGVLISQDSPLLVQAESAAAYESDIAATHYNTEIAKRQSLYQGSLYRMYGKSALQAGKTKRTATLLSGFGQIAGSVGSGMAGAGASSVASAKPDVSGYATLSSGRKVPVYGG
jgi:hypothetical protein